MARGRKPDPPGLQAAKGNPGRRRTSASARPAAAASGTVRPPKWLKKSAAATRIWNELAPLLEKLNALQAIDAFPLARYCRYAVDWVAADEAVRKEGVWYDTTDSNGAATKKRHPAFHARHELDKVLQGIEVAFGMRPDARFKMLRDQALVMNLPLFSAEARSGQVQGEPDESPAPPHEVGEIDPIGALARFDAPRGGRPN